MNNKQLGLVAAVVGVVLAAIIVLLVTGGPPTEELARDGENDVTVSEGPAPPQDDALADIRSTRVYSQEDDIIFEAVMPVDIPQSLRNETMSWRWEVLEGGSETWIVSANISVGDPIASVLSTQTGYGASTNDDTLPGELQRNGSTLMIRLRPSEIDDFPSEFTWRLETSLDGDRGNARSALAGDTAPPSGLGQFPPP